MPIKGAVGTSSAPGVAGLAAASASEHNGISYHGGPVLTGTVPVYLIWYGNWTNNTARQILPDLVRNYTGSDRIDINSTYYNGAQTLASVSIRLAGETTDNYSLGRDLTNANIQTIVSSAVASGRLQKDTNGLYFVLTADDVKETNPNNGKKFCSSFCGWHTYGTISGSRLKYAFVGNAVTQCASSCGAGRRSPNDNSGADGMASVIVHELEETISDPELNAWYAINGDENGDKCNWDFGTEYQAPNGAAANLHLGARDFLVQMNWVNAHGGFCANGYRNNDVGIVPEAQACPIADDLVTFYMDDEDSSNKSGASGWTGAFSSNSGSHLTFCKVRGDNFRPYSPDGSVHPYALLKLGRVCPPGSIDFSKYVDNEDDGNNNQHTGDIAPNQSANSYTRLNFCLFNSVANASSQYPDVGLASYGVLGPAGSSVNMSGWIRSDDEDSSNRDSMSCGSVCSDATQAVSAGDNTQFSVAQARRCDGTPGNWSGCRGTGCWVCAELVSQYPRYFANHPSCVRNDTCGGDGYGTCNAACSAPTDADR